MASAADITDPEVRAIFEAGEANGTLRFLYATTPSSTKYYVFNRLEGGEAVSDEKMTKMQIVGELGGAK